MPDQLYRLTFRPLAQIDTDGSPVPVEHRLRRLLKFALRFCCLRCVDMAVVEVPKVEKEGPG